MQISFIKKQRAKSCGPGWVIIKPAFYPEGIAVKNFGGVGVTTIAGVLTPFFLPFKVQKLTSGFEPASYGSKKRDRGFDPTFTGKKQGRGFNPAGVNRDPGKTLYNILFSIKIRKHKAIFLFLS